MLAEKDFRIALKIHPNQPSLLNYFGYSLVEKGIHLDEALQLIKRAVEKQPDDGYITDSLGWALYRLGKYSEAVIHMERAVELMPLDPIVNDHLILRGFSDLLVDCQGRPDDFEFPDGCRKRAENF